LEHTFRLFKKVISSGHGFLSKVIYTALFIDEPEIVKGPVVTKVEI
jgi:hypothetical protein